MAERPIFIPDEADPGLVRQLQFNLVWHSGFAPVQKKKNVEALHAAAARAGYEPLLEISTKSEIELGRRLSAFSLMFPSNQSGPIPLECAYQGSKVFERGGPYNDLYGTDVRSAKHDLRLKESGHLKRFTFENFDFPLEPKSIFYDWLYINTILPHRDWLLPRIDKYRGFTDIEFNPTRSINCQARSCALFVSLARKGLLDDGIRSPSKFIDLINRHAQYKYAIRGAIHSNQLHF